MSANPKNPDVYFLSAIAGLGGRKPFLAPLARIREVEGLIVAALSLEDRGIFHYFLAYVSFDYYERKSLNAPRPWQTSLGSAWRRGVLPAEIDSLFTLMSVHNPLPHAP